MERKILFYGSYFSDFYKKQNSKVRNKIDYVIDMVRNIDRVPAQFLKYLEGTDGLNKLFCEKDTKNTQKGIGLGH